MTIRLLILLLVASVTWVGTSQARGQDPDPAPADAAVDPPDQSPPPDPVSPMVLVARALREGTVTIDRLENERDPQQRQTLMSNLNRGVSTIQVNDPGNPRLHYLRGAMFFFSGRKGDAIDELNRFVETTVGRNEWKAHRMLGDLFLGEFPSLAKAKYSSAAALKPNEASILIGLSRCDAALGNTEDALSFARQAVDAVAPDSIDRMANLNYVSQLLAQDGQFEEAQRLVTAALNLAQNEHRKSPDSLAEMTTLHAQYRIALDMVRARLRETPNQADQYVLLTKYSREEVRIRGVISLIQILALLDSGIESFESGAPLVLLEERASLLVDLGRTEDAKEAYEELLRSHPNHGIARAFLQENAPEQPNPSPGE